MNWTKHATEQRADSDTGHRVVGVPVNGDTRYVAWGPDRTAGWNYRDWRDGRIPHYSGADPKPRYVLGERLPTPRVLLGVYPNFRDAAARCERDADEELAANDANEEQMAQMRKPVAP